MSRIVQASLSDELAEWFDVHFPAMSKQGFIEGCFRALRGFVEEGKMPTTQAFSEAAILPFASSIKIPKIESERDDGEE